MDTQTLRVAVTPSYKKDRVKAGIAHFGPGNFHRGHLAVIMDNYMSRTGDLNWGIVGITLRDPEKAAQLAKQKFSYHVVERADGICNVQRVDSLLDILHAPNDKKAVIDLLASPDIKLITMTITQEGYTNREGGYVTGDPTTVAGYIVHALEKRRVNGVPAPTLMSCDNIPDNGTELKKAVLNQANLFFPGLSEWIQEHVRFPDTMVDRIVPATRQEDVKWLRDEYGIHDSQAIFTEPFRQFVIQTRFSGEFPDLNRPEKGIVMQDKVGDYELMKIRMLNGTHFALGLVGTLAGYTYIGDALKNPHIRVFAEGFMREASGSLNPIPNVDFDDYQKRLFMRFDNPFMKDELIRLARKGSEKLEPRVLDIVRDLDAKHKDYRHMALVTAAWAHYVKGVNNQGQKFDILDERSIKNDWQRLANVLPGGKFIEEMHSIFGSDLSTNRPFRHAVGSYHMMLGRSVISALKSVTHGADVITLATTRKHPELRASHG